VSVPTPLSLLPTGPDGQSDVGEIAGEHARRTWLNYRQALPRVRCVSILVDSIVGTTMSGDEIWSRQTQGMQRFFPDWVDYWP
jgi:hypothetical protein